jgi:hypothetical protein
MMRWRRRAAPGASQPELAASQAEPAVSQPDPSAGQPEPAARPDPKSLGLAAWAEAVDASRLSDRTVKAAERFVRDYPKMNYLARREGGLRLRSVIESQVSPPPPATIAAVDVCATVLAARRKQLGIG